MPIADIKAVLVTDRMMAAMLTALPVWRLAAREPLSRHPPAANLTRPHRVGEIEDHYDISDIAVDFRRDVSVASIESEAVNSSAIAFPAIDLSRCSRIADIVDSKASTQTIGRRLLFGDNLSIHQHDSVRGLHLV